MNLIRKTSTAAVLAGVIALSPLAAFGYPSATGSVGREYVELKTSKSGVKSLQVSGAAEFNGVTLANKLLSVTLKLPNGTKVGLGTVKTRADGTYALNIKNQVKKAGVYKVYVTYRGKSTIVTITVK